MSSKASALVISQTAAAHRRERLPRTRQPRVDLKHLDAFVSAHLTASSYGVRVNDVYDRYLTTTAAPAPRESGHVVAAATLRLGVARADLWRRVAGRASDPGSR